MRWFIPLIPTPRAGAATQRNPINSPVSTNVKLWNGNRDIRCVCYDQGLEINDKSEGKAAILLWSGVQSTTGCLWLSGKSEVTLTSVKAWGKLQEKKHYEQSWGEARTTQNDLFSNPCIGSSAFLPRGLCLEGHPGSASGEQVSQVHTAAPAMCSSG